VGSEEGGGGRDGCGGVRGRGEVARAGWVGGGRGGGPGVREGGKFSSEGR